MMAKLNEHTSLLHTGEETSLGEENIYEKSHFSTHFRKQTHVWFLFVNPLQSCILCLFVVKPQELDARRPDLTWHLQTHWLHHLVLAEGVKSMAWRSYVWNLMMNPMFLYVHPCLKMKIFIKIHIPLENPRHSLLRQGFSWSDDLTAKMDFF